MPLKGFTFLRKPIKLDSGVNDLKKGYFINKAFYESMKNGMLSDPQLPLTMKAAEQIG
jgi:hypothetical protein